MTTDEAVLAYVGREGRPLETVAKRFPGFDMTRLVRAQLVEVVREVEPDALAHLHEPAVAGERYVLTARGAEAVGLLLD